MNPSRRHQRLAHRGACVGVLVGLWGVAVISGASWMTVSSATPKPSEPMTASLAPALPTPLKTTALPQWTVVMALHPKCPCSYASLAELERLLCETGGHLRATILVAIPAHAGDDWKQTRNTSRAAGIAGATVVIDPDGAQAAGIGLKLSGECALYNPAGQLVLGGGITSARGHEGDSVGHDSIRQIVNAASGQPTTLTGTTFQTFGCAIVRPLSQTADAQPDHNSRSRTP